MSKESPDPVVAEVVMTNALHEEGSSVEPTEQDLAAFRVEYENRTKRANRVDSALLVLFLLMVCFFVILAYRVEHNDSKISHGLYDACLSRVDTAHQYNIGREALVQMAISAPDAPTDPDQLAALVKQLRDGLLLPIEDCGAPPA